MRKLLMGVMLISFLTAGCENYDSSPRPSKPPIVEYDEK